jgi:hypothetical protein
MNNKYGFVRQIFTLYESRSRTPIEMVSKVILRHANLSATQRFLGKMFDLEAYGASIICIRMKRY